MNNYQKISQHTTNAVEHGILPAHRTDGYNFRAAGAIPFRGNVQSMRAREIKQATDARRERSGHLTELCREDCKPLSLNS